MIGLGLIGQHGHRKECAYAKLGEDVRRGLGEALVASATMVAFATALAVVVNPLLGRTIHWHILAVLMPSLFLLMTLVLKRRRG